MNKDELLQMTAKEIEKFLNDSIKSISIESANDTTIKGLMIEKVQSLFDSTINVSVPYYTNRELKLSIGRLSISFKVSTKTTGKTVEVSRLRKKDIKIPGKFKFDDISKLSEYSCSGGAYVSLKHRTEKIIDMVKKDVLFDEIQRQDADWSDIRKSVILSASQPRIKKDYFISDRYFNQEKWDAILQKTEENNKELIDSEIEKIFRILEP